MRLLLFMLALSMAIVLSACGQKGPLYLPEAKQTVPKTLK
ncbi:LPS translocon maturation chaperone LptM [Legionella fairfieldensis]